MPFFLLVPVIFAAKAAVVHLAHTAVVHTAATVIAHSAATAGHAAAHTAVHQAVVAGAAHIPTHSLLVMGGHVASTQVLPAAIAAGTAIGALKIIAGSALSALVFLGAVDKYRRLHHLDYQGQRKTEFWQIEPCSVGGCGCSDFSLAAEKKDGLRMCICGHCWGSHPNRDVAAMKREGKAYVEKVGKDAFKAALTDFDLGS